MYQGNKFYDVPGGGALYASLAVLVNGRTPSLNVCVGNDFPESVLVKLKDLGVNLNSIQYSNIPSRRASLKYINGNETEVTSFPKPDKKNRKIKIQVSHQIIQWQHPVT